MMKIVNVEHVGTVPGGVGYGHDRAIVIDTEQTEPHIITGKSQPKVVFRGTLTDAHKFLRDNGWAELR